MSIEYTYEIVAVDETTRTMEVIYSSVGRESIRVGARLPFAGEALEDVIKQFSPVGMWVAQETPVVVPTVGATGTIQPEQPPAVVEQSSAVLDPITNQPVAVMDWVN